MVAWRDTVVIVFVREGTAASYCHPSGTREETGSLVWHFMKVVLGTLVHLLWFIFPFLMSVQPICFGALSGGDQAPSDLAK